MNKNKYQIIAEFDRIRWAYEDNQLPSHLEDINYAYPNPSDEQKILIHWICYITDRQMPYQIIWDVGGFVFSDLVSEYVNGKSAKELLNPNSDTSFFKADSGFMSHTSANRKIKEQYLKDEKCVFKSRFYPIDYFSIYFTLSILEGYDNSIIKYMAKIIETVYRAKSCSPSTYDYIDALAKGLHLLSYDKISTFIDENSKRNSRKSAIQTVNTDNIIKLFRAVNGLSSERIVYDTVVDRHQRIGDWFSNSCRDKLTNDYKFGSSKRIWCSLRDYIKSPVFRGSFSEAMQKRLAPEIWKSFFSTVLDGNKGCRYIELPGDVWNENTTFRKCFSENRKDLKGKFGKILREKWNESDTWYPEQFDITFDIAPRMCEQNKCNVCVLSECYNNDTISRFCVNNEDKFCPIVLLHCGYHYNCVGQDKCHLYNLIL